ncbi:MAG: AI-2E family transporter [Planctomycetota bacterium]|nr:MAG: AI-2E family transporter [Planctomycetota bacterium]
MGKDADPQTGARRWPDRHLWEIQPVRDLGVIAIAIGLVSLGHALAVVTVPLLLALALAYLLEPIVSRLTAKTRLSRRAAAILMIVLLGVVVIAPLAVALVFAVVQAVDLASRAPDLIQRAADAVTPVLGADEAEVQATVERFRTWIEANIGVIAEGAARRGVGVAEFVARTVARTINVALLLFLVPFFFYFFSTSYPRVVEFGRHLIPKSGRERWTGLIGRMDAIVSAFIRGQFVIAAVLGAFHAIGWLIVGVPAALLLGAVAGVLSLVPYVIGVTLPVAIGLLWVDQQGAAEPMSIWWIILGPTVVYLLAQLLEGYVLQPIVHGKSTNLDAATIVAAVIAFASVAGIYGALLAIPVTACLKIIVTDVVWPRMQDWLEGRAEDPLPIGSRGDGD